MKKELPQNMKNRLNEWFSGNQYDVIQFWENDGTYYIVTYYMGEINCYRLWSSGDDYTYLSEDATYTV